MKSDKFRVQTPPANALSTLKRITARNLSLEQCQKVRNIVTNNYMESEDYKLARKAAPFLQGYREPGENEGEEGWVLIEFWSDDVSAINTYVEHINTQLGLTDDFPISQLRAVVMRMHVGGKVTGTSNVHYMHESQVPEFVKATIRLHHTHGNPGREGSPREGEVIIDGKPYLPLNNLWELRVHKLQTETVSHWWCNERLSSDTEKTAWLNQLDGGERAFAHPLLLADEKEAERLEEMYD